MNIPKINILKETPEERLNRVKSSGNSMTTKIVPNKKKLTKKQQRQKYKQLVNKIEE